MDSKGNDARICNGDEPSSVTVSKEGSDMEEEDMETSSLLNSASKEERTKGRRQRSRRKKVQWKDRNGNKLAEVLEFQPSDSGDSEDEYADSCMYAIQATVFGIAHLRVAVANAVASC
ncbi:hypothetical protein HPP92_007591 [Vanilla planifolia]|uniref:Uncharacterized protein n=1 Tax=Vanilla planifolia TaxID=51239 RepID=A0A835RR65_VANPL|nr:hypothetical protein HPP92_007739 [Vanilla planifolia]KAG0490728.1 hypothetical protein HPP92_007591 [Vanilla planifolia]